MEQLRKRQVANLNQEPKNILDRGHTDVGKALNKLPFLWIFSNLQEIFIQF